jgi:hypothetical protein
VGGDVVDGTVMVEVVGVDVVVGGVALDPPHAVKLAPISTSIPMNVRCVTLSL